MAWGVGRTNSSIPRSSASRHRPRPSSPVVRHAVRRFCAGLGHPGRLGELGRGVFVRDEERAQVALLTVFDRPLDFWALLTLMGASLFFPDFPPRRHLSGWRHGGRGLSHRSTPESQLKCAIIAMFT